MRCAVEGCPEPASWRAVLVVWPPLVGVAFPVVRAWCSTTFCTCHRAGAHPHGLLPPIPTEHIMQHGPDAAAYLPRVALEWQPLA